uniref:Crossover junction endonuclease MUS81 n=1 Tax=Poecilia mexicana TaxID=48701 RepID=A0A3B3WJ77_9TELE
MPASEPVRFGRKRALPSCPNPLFLQWLTDLRDEAKEKGLKIQYTYQKAINSLNKYPLPLKNAKEAKILQNFGDGICKILDDKLQRHYRQNGKKQMARDRGGDGGTKKKKKREYVPQQRSGGYAVLLTLYRQQQIPGSKGYMFKMELQSEAQPLCDKSFSVPDLGSKYTAWSSVSTLIQKNLLIKTHNPARYSLTDEGLALAERLESEEEEEEDAVVDLTASDEESSSSSLAVRSDQSLSERASGETPSSGDAGRLPLPGKTQVTMTTSRKPNRDCLLPGTYDVILCVDFIETTGGSHYRKQELVKELQRNGVGFDVRKLNVGDFLWVAREKVAPIPGNARAKIYPECTLKFSLQYRKSTNCRAKFAHQNAGLQSMGTFRLKRCGLRRPIYLVEGSSSSAAHLSLPEATLQQAIVNTQVVDGFFVKRVQDVRESAAYLTVMTRYLSKLYQNRTLVCRSRELEGDVPSDEEERGNPSCSLISFAEFNHGAVKNKCQTVREVFARQLMQISGLSGDKAAAILEQYGTPHSLLAAYEKCGSESEKEKLLSCIRYGKLKRNLGPALSRTVYQLYCTPGALT